MSYTFSTLDNPQDAKFNQLLAINNSGTIAGYFGDGTVRPNKGYTLAPPHTTANYTGENFPTSAQTQVTGINNGGITVGFWVDGVGDNLGFIDINGQYTTALDPSAPALGGATPVTEQFLGINDLNEVAGFYNDASGNSHGFVYNAASGSFTAVNVTGATSVTATDINDLGQISGFFTNAKGVTDGFVDINGAITTLAGPSGATDVQALGLNDNGLIVGSYMATNGDTDGFVYDMATKTYTTVVDPSSTGTTVVNGINDQGDLVGFYSGVGTNVFHGMLVTPPAPTLSWTLVGHDDNAADPTFNQLLSINNAGTVAGYFGSGSATSPNKGYTLAAPYSPNHYVSENFPTSAQTQVTGINNAGTTVGFWVDGAGDNLGFVDQNGQFTNVLDPAAPALGGTTPITEQLLGLNDFGKAVGFYNDASGNSHGFVFNMSNGTFSAVNVAGATSVTATGINDSGQISGFYTEGGNTEGFLDISGKITTLSGPAGATDVQALGLNNNGLVVGSYVNSSGQTDGFVYDTANSSYTTIVDSHALGMTIVNGVNDLDQIVGFYFADKGNTQSHGFIGSLTTPLGTGALGSIAETPTTVGYNTVSNTSHLG